MNWNFIMQASQSFDLYSRGKERILIDRKTLNVVYYYVLGTEIALI